mmetsp:Transcript_22241/g.30334  ORF Transcript_22241/g.30334 Transcript_22241/m.30334 type:complete len:882 (-) Transcript_22241:649-3294(-)|eukprot:CAMPEP_0185757966 /NCGR_PEP_ID=MMETSP1174-20130828/16489_1 /TAXON_ID=35687 /ORGANISM="Dictyocha speculum, Strain CCMP1381" /LENGTH=881 /DNA_ID=CAMNT_0028437591 /DNA_START=59 /DNA_END=2707 /DNA_ORIENTATION=-
MASNVQTDLEKRIRQRFEELTQSGVPANEAAAEAIRWVSSASNDQERTDQSDMDTATAEEMTDQNDVGTMIEEVDVAESAMMDVEPQSSDDMRPEDAYVAAFSSHVAEAGDMEEAPDDTEPIDDVSGDDAVSGQTCKASAASESQAAEDTSGGIFENWMNVSNLVMADLAGPSESLSPARLQFVGAQCMSTQDWRPMVDVILQYFSDPTILSASFLAAPSKVENTVGSGSGGDELLSVDMTLVDQAYHEILKHESEEVVAALLDASTRAVDLLMDTIKGQRQGNILPPDKAALRGAVALRAIVVLLANPQILERVTMEAQDLVKKLCMVVALVPKAGRTCLSEWLATVEDTRFQDWLKGLQQFITLQVFQAQSYTSSELEGVLAAVQTIKVLYEANAMCAVMKSSSRKRNADEGCCTADRIARGKPKAKYEDFYNDAINEELFAPANHPYMRNAYREWLRDQSMERNASKRERSAEEPREPLMPESVISYPFVLTAATKARVLQVDAQHQMHRGVNQEFFNAILNPGHRLNPYLVLRVRRENIVQDTLTQLVHCPEADLKKPLKVIFEGEDGIDEGGVQKEFMQVVTRELLDPAYAMFKVDEDTRHIFFNPHTFEIGLEFELIGLLIGVAIYNSIILDIPFPMVVYKRLKGMPPTLHDLLEAQPMLGKSLRKMLEYEGDVKDTFGAYFQVSYEVWGDVVTHDLVSGGGDIPVTNDNVYDYVNRYVHWALVGSVDKQSEAFHKGFMRVCGGNAIELFTALELELLVCGNPTLDFDALEKVTHYEDGFEEESDCIRNFWQVVHSFSDEEKRQLLKFATGSDRAPINGLASLTFVISRNGGDSDRLPTSHTCFNHLLLPEYSSVEKLEEKLRTAINQAEGFGLR